MSQTEEKTGRSGIPMTDAKKELQTFIRSLLRSEGSQVTASEEMTSPQEERIDPSRLPLFDELIHHMKGSLSAMKTFAFLSRDNFKEAELGEHFYEIISEDIEKTLSMLDCYCDYLRFNAPVPKKDTVRTLIEEILKDCGKQLKDKNISIIKKQFETGLPETTVPDAALRYALETLIRYALRTMPRDAGLGFLTRPYDPGAENGTSPSELQKAGTYIEILMVSTHHEKPSSSSKAPPNVGAANGGAGTGLMLELAREVVRKNRGVMKVKAYDEKAMIFFTLILPVERRKVVRFPQQRLSEKRVER